jgi:hypothetical protein
MTDNEINELKNFLQKKIDILIPKKFKWIKDLKITNINYVLPIFRGEGSLEITIDAKFDYTLVNFSETNVSDMVKKTSTFVKNLVSTVEPNKDCYVYWV